MSTRYPAFRSNRPNSKRSSSESPFALDGARESSILANTLFYLHQVVHQLVNQQLTGIRACANNVSVFLYCSKLYGLTPDERVFYMTCTSLNKELTRCTRIASLPDIRVHDLRHSHASLCIELGYSALLVAKRLGDTVPVVMKTYAHLYPNKQAELVSKLEDLAAPENEDSGYLGSL